MSIYNTCNHVSYYYEDIEENKTPTDEEINKYRLWKCPKCNKWITFKSNLLRENRKRNLK